MLCNHQGLAKTSAAPGKTKLINHYDVISVAKSGGKNSVKWYLVDLPGYGYAKISQTERKKWEKMIEDYLLKRENLMNIFVLIDSRHNPQKADIDFVNKLGEWQLPFTLVFTKADKEKPQALQRNVKAFLDAMRETWQFLPQSFITSAEKKTGRDEVLAFIEKCNEEAIKNQNS